MYITIYREKNPPNCHSKYAEDLNFPQKSVHLESIKASQKIFFLLF